MNIPIKKLTIQSSLSMLLATTAYAAPPRSDDFLKVAETDIVKSEHVDTSSQGESDDSAYQSQKLRDAWLHGKLEVAITLNRHLNPFSIDTGVENGVATLSGNVKSEIDKELAEELARSISGIVDVKNELAVRDGTASSRVENNSWSDRVNDLTITASVKTKLLASKNTAGLAIDVTTRDNVVYLEGNVSSDEEKKLAGLVAKNTEGVRQVNNELEVVE